MKKVFTNLLFLIGFIIYLSLLGNRSGAPAGATGAPDEATCGNSSCHNASPNSGSATVSLQLDGGARDYTPGETHKISIAIDNPQNAGRNGFEIVALNEQDANVGEWILSGNDKRARSANNRDYITQTADGSGQSSWEIDWKAPAADAGRVTFYLAYNDANDNGGRTGDNIYTNTLGVDEAITSSITAINGLTNSSVYPNPFKEVLNLKLQLSQTTELSGTLFNQSGQSIKRLFHRTITSGESLLSFPVDNNLSNGMYFLELRSAEGGVQNIPLLKL